MMTLNDCTNYIITKTCDDGGLSVLKLQKLVYYAQAWHLAFNGTPLFAGKFEAWVHGPVNRELYKRFAASKQLYSAVTRADVGDGFKTELLNVEDRRHIDNVLETYAGLSGTQLEELTHSEAPWRSARGDLPLSERCEKEIDELEMGNYYRARLSA